MSVSRIKRLSEDVIGKITAGEVINRPVNAVKELIENSLDAKSTLITVKVKDGGKELIQVQDNGTGIVKEDFKLVCEKHCTSKLRDFNDLQKLNSFGFRGEALSSISMTSNLTIISKTDDSLCGYQMSFRNGVAITQEPQSTHANQGTIVKMEEIFSNMRLRRNGLKSSAVEYALIVDLITQYAIHYSGQLGFNLISEKSESPHISTVKGAKTIDNIRILYGKEVANHLWPVLAESTKGVFKMSGLISDTSLLQKKFTFILFINDRLVECKPLKKSVEALYARFLVKGGYPFVYMSLQMDPINIDVNVHPAKSEVRFLYDDHVYSEICTCVLEKLNNLAEKRVMALQASPVVQVKATEPKLRAVGAKSSNQESKGSASSPKYPSGQIRTDAKNRSLNDFIQAKNAFNEIGPNDTFDEIELSSICDLRTEVEIVCDQELRKKVMNLSFVGCLNAIWFMVQHDLSILSMKIESWR